MFISRDGRALTYINASWRPDNRLADEAFEFYLDWRDALATCESAYRRWATIGVGRDAGLAFAAYTAALDREQQAALQYEAALYRDNGS